MFEKNILKNLDIFLIFLVICLFIISIIFIGSTSYDTSFHITREIKVQTFAFILGIISIGVILMFDYNTLESLDKVLYFLCILLLLAVYIPGIGKVQFGARSWIDLGPLDLQPSEVVKIIFIISFAKYLSINKNNLTTLKGVALAGLYCAPIILLVLIEPDLGNAAVLSFISAGMIFAAGIDYKLLLKLSAVIVASIPIMYRFMEEHQRIRIDAFLNPEDLSLPGNYQVWNSKVAIGSGNLLGKGLWNGTQKKLKFLPVQESDFIFAVLAEELGFVGGMLVILIYLLFLYRITYIAKKAKDSFGTLIVIGILSMFAFQIFENIGMTMGVMPVTGITLPFISYGGSSLLTNMIALGLVLNIGMRHHTINF